MTDGSLTSGVFGLAHALSGVSYGVRGESDSPDGFSGYFVGTKFYISGNAGIGVENPTTKLDVNGQVRIRGGSPGAGKVLTSDATGLASWQTPVSSPWQTSSTNIYYSSGNVGLGISTPAALLHAQGTGYGQGSVVFAGEVKTNYAGSTRVVGTGTRMMWYPDRAAFRAGYVSADQWNATNIGFFSTASGSSTTASGGWSTAFGESTVASGQYSTALGSSTTASARFSTSFGESTIASGQWSIAMGNSSTASGNLSMSVGYETIASGTSSTARGWDAKATGNYSTAVGQFITAPSYFETVIGCWGSDYTPISSTAWNDADRLFVISNGTSYTSRRNAITVLKNGKTGIGTDNPGYKLDVVGDRIRLIESGTNDWIALRTDGGTNDYLDFSYGGGSLVIQGSTTNENIIMNPSMNRVGIRTWTPQYDLDVNGNIRAIGSIYYGGTATTAGTPYNKPDYVFGEEYKVFNTEEVEMFLEEKKHLPWVTSAVQEKQENGGATDMTRMAFETLESVENLQLQVIRQQNLIKEQNAKINALEKRLSKLESPGNVVNKK